MGDLISREALLENYGLKNAVKYGNKTEEQQHNSYSTLMLYEVADMIWDAPAVDAAQWVSVEEMLPEEVENVLVFSRHGDVTWIQTAYRIKKHWWQMGGPISSYVTHWMPLPEPPKMEEG